HASGSLEEIDRLLARGARVLMYFCSADVPQSLLQDEQYDQLQAFKARMRPRGLLGQYSEISNLREQVALHLTTVVADLLARDRGQPAPAEGAPEMLRGAPKVITAPRPDIRVYIRSVVVAPAVGQREYI